MSEEVKREANENIQIHDAFQAQEQESKEKEAKVKGDKSLKAALVQQTRTAPDMSEEVKREANENIQIHDAFQAQEQESKEREAKVKGDKSLKAALVQQDRRGSLKAETTGSSKRSWKSLFMRALRWDGGWNML